MVGHRHEVVSLRIVADVDMTNNIRKADPQSSKSALIPSAIRLILPETISLEGLVLVVRGGM